MTRDRLLAAGRHLLERGAFEATSIADIAAEAGCSVGAFYQRFADKEAFFAVVMQSALAEIVADAKRTATEPAFTEGPIEDVLQNCVVHWVQTVRICPPIDLATSIIAGREAPSHSDRSSRTQ